MSNALMDFVVKATVGICGAYVLTEVSTTLYSAFLSTEKKLAKLEGTLSGYEEDFIQQMDRFKVGLDDHVMLASCHAILQQRAKDHFVYSTLNDSEKADLNSRFHSHLRTFVDRITRPKKPTEPTTES